jgi:lipopolysaccharide heptosyltransferase II
VFNHLHIHNRAERWLVGAADLALSASALITRRSTAISRPPTRILLLRLERIGDLLMTLPALAKLRAAFPIATIDLVVGSWNASLARLLTVVDHVETVDAPWLVRGHTETGYLKLTRQASHWRTVQYDLAFNFEGDIRSNALLALCGAPRRVGFAIKGGGALLTDRATYDRQAHVATNAMRLVDTVLPHPHDSGPADDPSLLVITESVRTQVRDVLKQIGRPAIGVHASGGRAIKQWDPARFAEAATKLARSRGATIVLTGSAGDRAEVDRVKTALPSDLSVIDLSGTLDLPRLAVVLEHLSLFITGDTGPMHLAAAMGTPIVAVFGPSDPANYGPLTSRKRVARVNIWCSPCNQIRRPPSRCVGHVPDCLVGVEVDQVVAAANDLLANEGVK